MATRLKRLKIEQFRDVAPGTELHFHHGWNVLLGRNGSGKTTLLHLISMVMRDDFGEVDNEAFSLEYELEAPGALLTVQVTNEALPPQLVRSVTHIASVRYTLSSESDVHESGILADSDIFELMVGNKMRSVPASGVLRRARMGMYLGPPTDENVVARGRSIAESNLMCFRIDEAVSLFDVIAAAPGFPRPSVPTACLIGLARQPSSVPSWVNAYGTLVPPSIVAQVAQTYDPTRPIVELSLSGDDLLDRLLTSLGFQRIVLVGKLRHSQSTVQIGEFELTGYRASGPPLRHDRWSFGQQRLFAIFWYLACNPDVLIADELTNGLHWEWIQACVASIADRQVFVAVQNPLLLEHVGFETEEEVQRAFVMCRTETDAAGAPQMRWVQPDPEQAARFYRAWKRGIQPVHEVLMTEGLW